MCYFKDKKVLQTDINQSSILSPFGKLFKMGGKKGRQKRERIGKKGEREEKRQMKRNEKRGARKGKWKTKKMNVVKILGSFSNWAWVRFQDQD